MSLYGGGNTGSTYQSIVIALVAGGILSTGVLSILWKRRQARRWMEMRRRLPPGGNAARGGAGGGVGGSLGREPGIWDVVFGSGSASGGVKPSSLGEDINEKDGVDELDLEGTMGKGWRPTSLSLTPSSPTISNPTLSSHPPPPTGQIPHIAGITVLIAMPDPNSPSTSSSTPHPSSSTYDLPSYSSIYQYPTSTSQIQGYDDEEDDGRPLPLLEMGQTTMSISLPPSSGLKGDLNPILDKLLAGAAAEREAASIPRRHRNRSTAWDGVALPQPNAVDGGLVASRPAGALPPPEHQSLAARMAMIRNGALAGFGAAPTRR